MVRHGKGPLKVEGSFNVNDPVTVGSCQSITVLKTNPRAKEGMDMLKKIASLVAPIMRKHSWTLPQLGEFFPDNPNLLGINVNRGQKIFVRLRPSHAPDTFLDMETQVMGTMLHELTHNVHGPHDQKFYAFLDKLQDEYDELRTKGYSGEGFLSAGNKLSTAGHDANLPLAVARQRGLEAAAKRQKQNILGGSSSGYRLGGAGSTSNKSPRELAAEAAERRFKDEKECGAGQAIDAQAEANKANAASVNRIIDLSMSSDESGDDIVAVASSEKVASTSKVKPLPPTSSTRPKRKEPPSPDRLSSSRVPVKSVRVENNTWPCEACTFLNPNERLQCEVCDALRPNIDKVIDRKPQNTNFEPEIDGWTCHLCHTAGNDHNFWSCKTCGTIKTSSTR